MKTYFVLTVLILAQINLCYSQWIQTGGPYGSTTVLTIIEHDSLLLSGTNCGYFSKNQLSDDWVFNSTLRLSCYAKKGDSLFVGTIGNGIKLFDLTIPDNPPVDLNPIEAKTLAYSDSCLYLGNDVQGFMKSSDYGITWNAYNSGFYESNVTDIELSNNYIYCGTSRGVFRNDRNLSSWIPINSGLPIFDVTLVEEINDTLYTGIISNLYRSLDYGITWEVIYEAPSDITSFLIYDNAVYIGTEKNGIYYSTDNCASWSELNSGLTNLNIKVLSVYDSTLICGTNSRGIYYFQNDEWIGNRAGMICSTAKSIVTTSDAILTNDRRNVYFSSNGNTWHSGNVPEYPVYNGLSSGIGSLMTMEDTIFVSYNYSTPEFPYFYSYIKYSLDTCNTWNDLISNVPYIGDDPYRMYSESGRLYAYEDDGMFYTENLGLSWTDISLPPQSYSMFEDLVVHNSTPFAVVSGGGRLLRLDNNQNWVLSNTGLPTDLEVRRLATCDSALFVFAYVYGMYVSFDNGENWNYAGNGLNADYDGIRDYINYGSDLFVTTKYGVFVTSNYGQEWYAINDGLKNLNTTLIDILHDTLYVGTYGNGIWKRNIKELNLSVPEHQFNNQFLKIYPNPASDYIHIAANFNKAEFKILDMVGKEILSGKLNTSNEINISGIKSGVYIVFLQSDKKAQATKLIISR